MSNDNLICPAEFSAQEARLERHYTLASLDTRVTAHAYLADTANTDVAVCLQGGRDAQGRAAIRFALQTTLSLICQRCLSPMQYRIDEATQLVLFTDEAQADAALQEEDIDILMVTGDLDVRMLVEEQILMAIPYAPMHEQCTHQRCNTTEPTAKTNAFAVLLGIEKPATDN